MAQPTPTVDGPPPIQQPWRETGRKAPWQAQLRSGGQVLVDPQTNRATVRGPDGYETQLWDGVHRLNDGTELTVRDGRVVPNEEMMRRRDFTPEPALTDEPVPNPGVVGPASTPEFKPPQSAVLDSSPCAVLVRQACGRNDACAGETKCSAARQLVDMAAEEKARGADPRALTGTELKCREALTDSFFAPCEAADSPASTEQGQ
jgi:hypothetical protein